MKMILELPINISLNDLNDLQKATNEQLSYSPDKVNKEIEALDKKVVGSVWKIKKSW